MYSEAKTETEPTTAVELTPTYIEELEKELTRLRLTNVDGRFNQSIAALKQKIELFKMVL